MSSTQRYKDRACANPACGISFTPTRRNQQYCEPQCRINYHNDQKHEDNQERYVREKAMRACDRALEVLVESAFYKDGEKAETVLDTFAIDRTIGTLEVHLNTGGLIRWYHAYGIEQVCLYTIYYRTKVNL